jgi:hypothetical protein
LDEPLAAAMDEDLDPVDTEDGTMFDAMLDEVIDFDECSGFLWHLEEPWLLEDPASDFLEVLCALEHSAGFFLDEPLAAAMDEDLDPVAMEDGTMSDAVINFDECSGFLWHLEEPWLLEDPASDFLEVLCALEHSAGFFWMNH